MTLREFVQLDWPAERVDDHEESHTVYVSRSFWITYRIHMGWFMKDVVDATAGSMSLGGADEYEADPDVAEYVLSSTDLK